MKRIAFFLLFTITSIVLIAQTKKGEIVVSKTDDLKNVLTSKTQYLLDEFVEGTVYYTNGRTSRGMLNYNLLLDEIHFISPDEKVLALSEPNTINFISLGRKIFVFNSRYGYMEVAYNGNIKLLIKRKLEVKQKEYEFRGAYGETSTSASIGSGENAVIRDWSVSRFGDANTIVEGEVLYTEQFFLQDKSKRTNIIANLRPFERIVGKKNRETLREYIKSEGIDIKNLEDLNRLTQWVDKL